MKLPDNEIAFLEALKKYKQKFSGKIYLPAHRRFSELCAVYNKGVITKPLAIINIQQVNDIRHAVNLARKHQIPLSIKGGGHSPAGGAIVPGGVVLNMTKLSHIHVNPPLRRVDVMPGVLNDQLNKQLIRSDQALPLGTCGEVGVVGSTLGGGIGYLSRQFGLVADNVEQFTLINNAGEILTVNDQQNVDLFWALRGSGGGQFGVVSQIRFRTQSIVNRFFGGIVEWPVKYARTVLRKYNDLMMSAPDHYFFYAYISRAQKGEAKISIMGYLHDVPDQYAQGVIKTIMQWAPQVSADIRYRDYLDIQSNVYDKGYSICWKHGFIHGDLTDDFIDAFVDCFERCPSNSGGLMLDPLGGAINRYRLSDSAFIHRNSNFICSITGLSGEGYLPAPVKQWVSVSYQQLSSFFTGYAYQNYEDMERDEVKDYFGSHADKLIALKRKHDPDCLFYGSLSRHIHSMKDS